MVMRTCALVAFGGLALACEGVPTIEFAVPDDASVNLADATTSSSDDAARRDDATGSGVLSLSDAASSGSDGADEDASDGATCTLPDSGGRCCGAVACVEEQGGSCRTSQVCGECQKCAGSSKPICCAVGSGPRGYVKCELSAKGC